MARESDIQSAFMGFLELDGRGRQTLTTEVFQKWLADLNHLGTLTERNRCYKALSELLFPAGHGGE